MRFNNFIKLGFAIACVSQMYAAQTGKVHHVGSESDFNSLIGKGTAALVKFEAQWCGPCKKSAPVFEQMAAKHTDILFLSVDIDKVPSLKNKYRIASVPTLIVFNESGEMVKTSKGFNSSELLEAIKPFEGEKKSSKEVKAEKPAPTKKQAPAKTEKAAQTVKKEEPKKAAPEKTEMKKTPAKAEESKKDVAAEKKTTASKGMIEIKNKDHLTKIINEGGIVVAKFAAEWCAPCKDAEEPLSYIVNDYSDVTFVSIDIDCNKPAQKEHNVTSVPTFVIFKDGKEIDRLVSFFDPALRAKIDDAKSGKKSALAQVRYVSGPTVS